MIINYPGSDWIIQFGPISRTNHAGTKTQAEEGAKLKLMEAAKEIMEKARPLVPLLQEGALCTGGDCLPRVEEEEAEVFVVNYELTDSKWFSIATTKKFGYKLVCKKSRDEEEE